MSLFDSILGSAGEKFGLTGDKAGGLLTALLGLISDPQSGGFTGFIDRFKAAGLGDKVSSWIASGDNTPISNDELESALGAETLNSVAEQAGVEKDTAASAITYMLPQVVDKLTPDGEIPDESSLLSKLGGYLTGFGGAAAGAVLGGLGAVGTAASGAADKVGDTAGAAVDKGKEIIGGGIDAVGGAAGATYDKGKEIIGGGIGAVGDAAGAVGGKVTGALGSVGNALEGGGEGGGSILKWLLPLIILGLLVVLGYWFCGKSTPPTPTNTNANTANKTNANANANAGNKADTNANGAATGADKKLTEVALPNGTKLQAFPGGIEDQLIKFIQSDEFKNGTNDTLKDKWFNFDDLNFKTGSAQLVAESKRQLDNIAAILKAFPDVKIKIGGYTDKTGDDAKNKALSDGRAKAVKAELDKAGVGAQVPQAEGYGEEFAKVPETASDQERAADRKTAIRLLK